MNRGNRGRLLWALLGLLGGEVAFAAPAPHLLFHMGIGSNGQFAVRATIANRGDQPVAHGYLVISTRDAYCRPLEDMLAPFGELAPGQQREVAVPLPAQFDAYHLTAFKAFDDMSAELPVVDETEAIIRAREPEERLRCQQARLKAASQQGQ